MTNLGATTHSAPLVRTTAPGATRPTTVPDASQRNDLIAARHDGCGSAHGAGAGSAPQKTASTSQVAGASGGGATDGVAQLHGGGTDATGLAQALQSIMTMMTQLLSALNGGGVTATGGGAISMPASNQSQARPTTTAHAAGSGVAGASGGGASVAPQKRAAVHDHGTTQMSRVGGASGGGAATVNAGSTAAGAGAGTLVSGGGVMPPRTGETRVGGASGPGQAPGQRPDQFPGQFPVQAPTQTAPRQGTLAGGPGTDAALPIGGGGAAAPVAGTVTLSDRDSGKRMTLRSASGNEVSMYGDPHVSMKLDGRNVRFDIGSGPGQITLQDGTNITWDTYAKGERGSIRNLKVFSVDSAGTEFDRSIKTNDGVNSANLTTTLTDAQLHEFATELYAYKGSISKPLTRSGATLPG